MILLQRFTLFLLCLSMVFTLSQNAFAQSTRDRGQSNRQERREPLSIAVLEGEYQKSEEDLRLAYNDLIKLVEAFPDEQFKVRFEAAQVAWAKFRGEHSKLLADAAEKANVDWTATLLEEVTRQNVNRTSEIRVIFMVMERVFKERYPSREFSAPSQSVVPGNPVKGK